MLFLYIKIHDSTTFIHTNNLQPTSISNTQNLTHLINKLYGSITGKELSHLLVEPDGCFDTVHEGHSYSAFSCEDVLDVLVVIDVLVTAALGGARRGLGAVVS